MPDPVRRRDCAVVSQAPPCAKVEPSGARRGAGAPQARSCPPYPHSSEARVSSRPGPTRQRLKISPATAPQIAEGSVAFLEQKFGFRLPYTPESLILVDAIIDKVRETGAAVEQARSVLAGLGCYVGEVFVRHARASWRSAAEMGMSDSAHYPIVLALPGPTGCDPIGPVFERFSSGTASLARLYEALVMPAAADRRS